MDAHELHAEVQRAIGHGQLQRARALVFHWLKTWAEALPEQPSRHQLRQPELWTALADVVERTSDHYLIERFWQILDQLPAAASTGSSHTSNVLMGVPLLNRFDLLERLLMSLDHPIDTLAIVDNSIPPEGSPGGSTHLSTQLEALRQLGHPMVRQIRIARPFCNLGVAASWNLILSSFPQAATAFLANNDVILAPGILSEALRKLNPLRAQFLPLLPEPNGFSAFFITSPCWDRIGLFDASFHPAYCEDLDYRDRLRNEPAIEQLSGDFAHEAMARLNPHHSATIASDPAVKAHNTISYALNRLWYFSQRRLRHDPRGTWRRLWLAQWSNAE
jgi:hypothetical protein